MKKTAFTKEESLALKAVAVLMIIMHHSISGNSVYWGFALNFFPFAESQVNHIGAYCKICVGIFAFITGYGITEKYRDSEESISRQAFSQYVSSIKAFLPVFIICVFLTAIIDGRPFTTYAGQSPIHSVLNFLLDGFGLAKLMGTPNLDGSWWYLSAMTVFCFAAPLFRKIVQRTGWLAPFFALIVFPRLIGMGYLPGADIQPFYFLMPVLLGVIFAEYDIFERLDNFQLIKTGKEVLDNFLKLVVTIIALLVSYKVFHHLPGATFWEYPYAFAPLMFIIFFHECMHFFPRLKHVLAGLGKHSGNIYFVHGLLLGHYLRDFLFSMPLLLLTPLVTYAVGLAFSLALEACKTYLHKELSRNVENGQGKMCLNYLRGYWHSGPLRLLSGTGLFVIMLFLLDLGLRNLHSGIGITGVYDLVPRRFTLLWIIILATATLLLPGVLRKIFIGVVGVIFLLLFLTHSMMMQAKGNFFSFNSLMYAADGFRFLDVSYIQIDSRLWLIFGLGILLLILSVILVPRKGLGIWQGVICLALIAAGIWGINSLRDSKLSDRLENHSESYGNYSSVLYNNFSDPNACLMLCGLYQYTFRDFCFTYGLYDRFNNVNHMDQIAMLDVWYESKETDPDNEWTGRFAGENLILVQLEAIDSWMLNEQFMPNLYGLQQKSINFAAHYSPMYSDAYTFNTEMLANTSGIVPFTGARFTMYNHNSYPYALASLMRAKGYRTNSFHRSPPYIYNRGDIHANWGYERYCGGEDMGIPEEELDFDTALMRAYDLMTPNEPFLSFIITFSAHGPYEHSPVSDYYFDTAKKLLPPDTDEMIIHAMARAKVTDEFIGQLYDRLEVDGLLDNTVLVFYTDHYNYYAQRQDLIFDFKGAEDINMATNTPFFIYEKNTAPLEVTKVTSSIDILPTLVNLFDLDTDGRYYVGNDAFSPNGGYVIFKDFSWYDGETYWNTAAPGELTPEIQARNEELMHRLEMSWESMRVNYFSAKQ